MCNSEPGLTRVEFVREPDSGTRMLNERYLALCERLHETEPPPRKLIRQVILDTDTVSRQRVPDDWRDRIH